MSIPRLDKISGAVVVIDYLNYFLNCGELFFVERPFTLNKNNTLRFATLTPPEKYVHGISILNSSGVLEFSVDEDCDVDFSNYPKSKPLNNDRNSTNTPDLVIYFGVPEPISYKERISHALWGADIPGRQSEGGSYNRPHGVTLKRNTKYVWTVKSHVDINHINLLSFWIETMELPKTYNKETNDNKS